MITGDSLGGSVVAAVLNVLAGDVCVFSLGGGGAGLGCVGGEGTIRGGVFKEELKFALLVLSET